jgi:DNA polymerase I
MKKKHFSTRQPLLFPESDVEPSSGPSTDLPSAALQDTASSELASPNAIPPVAPAPPTRIPKSRLEAGDLVIVVDSHSLIYQVFHALPPMTGPNGEEVGAVHGFLRDLADLRSKWQPDFLICAFDESDVTFRNQLYSEYKAHRDPMPEALRAQMPLIHRAVETLDIAKLSMPGFEADDILATIAAEVEKAGGRCLLVTSDKDCRQLLSDRVQMLNIRKSELYGVEQLQETWGIAPHQVVDFQAMVGDTSDNVPGVPQIGPKAAQQLLAEFGSLYEILNNVDRVAGNKRQETLRTHRDSAILSEQLVRLRKDVPIEWNWPSWGNPQPDLTQVESMFRDFGIRRLAERFVIANSPAPNVTIGETLDRSKYRCAVGDPQSANELTTTTDQRTIIQEAPSLCPVWIPFESLKQEILAHYQRTPECDRWLAIDTETTSLSARDAEPVGYSIAWSLGQAAYLPVRGPQPERLLDHDSVKNFLKQLLEDPTIPKIGQNIKYDLIVLRGQGLSVHPIGMDTMVADYLLEPGGRNHNLDELAKRHLGHETITIDTLIGSGKDQRSMESVDVDRVAIYAAEDVDVPFRLRPRLLPRLQSAELDRVFSEIELPLIEVLAEMEFNGIAIDTQQLAQLSRKFEDKITILHSEIMLMAGEDFNPDSPKQLANILFNKLNLRVVKKTKTGPSTDVEVLQELASEHPLPAKIVEYRQATKLKGTYIDALPRLISTKTGRLHTSFRQDIAATGRLSSSDPNLQNIPVRTEDGRAIRSAFRPGPDDWLLMTADYSQIELRVLAHYCDDASLKNAFENDEDIHARVAAEVHGVSVADVTSAMRRGAKAINFGILYGQSPFGLAKALGISKGEAASFIDTYFDRYKSVRNFMRETLDACRRDGFVKTISGRKRYLQGIRDFATLNPQQQKTLLEPERMAVNTVIQGSAADMIKIAMIRVHRRLRESNLQAKLLLQIHDELVFEVAPQDVATLSEMVRKEMIEAVAVNVPLKVDIKVGPNWAACQAW